MKAFSNLLLILSLCLATPKAWSGKACRELLQNKVTALWDTTILGDVPNNLMDFQLRLKARQVFFQNHFVTAIPRGFEFTGNIEQSLREYSRLVFIANILPQNFFFEDWQKEEQRRYWLSKLELAMLLESREALKAYSSFDDTLGEDIARAEERIETNRNSTPLPYPGNEKIFEALERLFVDSVEVFDKTATKEPEMDSTFPETRLSLAIIYREAPIPKARVRGYFREILSLTSTLQIKRYSFRSVDQLLNDTINGF